MSREGGRGRWTARETAGQPRRVRTLCTNNANIYCYIGQQIMTVVCTHKERNREINRVREGEREKQTDSTATVIC